MEDIVLNEVTKAMDVQNERLHQQGEEIKKLREDSAELFGLKGELKNLQLRLEQTRATISQFQGSAGQLRMEVNGYRKELSRLHPISHHHHFPKIAILIIVQMVIIGGLSAGWWSAWQNGLTFRNADTQIKYMGLHADSELRTHLQFADSLVSSNPEHIRDSVLHIREIRFQYQEAMDKAEELKRQGYGQ